jgi:hypothetical protein
MSAPKKFTTPIDLTQLQLLNVQLQQLGSDPGSPVVGQLWFRSDVDRPRWYDGTTSWYIYPSTTADTPNTEVLRDGSGNFSAGTITANLTGTASQATTLDSTGSGGPYYNGSYYLNRANQTGTQTASTISDFTTAVEAIPVNSLTTPTGSWSNGGYNITNLANPVNPQDAATKAYVDASTAGLTPKAACEWATTAALPAYTFSSTAGGTLTANANGALSIDGGSPLTNDRVLVKNESGGNAPYNGIYVVTQTGSGSTPYILTRSTDANSSALVTTGIYTFIIEGTSNANTGWILDTLAPITLNTTSLSFVQFTGAADIIAGNGISKSVNTISVNATSNFQFTGGQLELSDTGVSAGTYTSVTVDVFGRVDSASQIVTSTGFVACTGAGTFSPRTLTGTAGQIDISNGAGIAGNPVVSIDSGYVGQTSITTLGTITTGTWNGTAVSAQYGGTGLNTSSAANGTLLIGNGSGFSLATLTAGTNISIVNGAGTITINATSSITGSGTAGQVTVWNGTNSITGYAGYTFSSGVGLTVQGTSPLVLTQSAATSGAPIGFTFTGGAHTNLSSGTEVNSFYINLSATETWITSTPSTQRAIRITNPTYACSASSQVIATAATVSIDGAPIAGTNVSITNSYALQVAAGASFFGGTTYVTSTGAVLALTQSTTSGGTPQGFNYTGGTLNLMTSGTEVTSVLWGVNHTVQWASSTPVTQREFRILAPTYTCNTALQTITNGATVAISGAPIAGTNVSITNNNALIVESGQSTFNGNVMIGDGYNFIFGSTTGTMIGTVSTQKFAFFGATPVIQQTGDVATALSTYGLVTSPVYNASGISGIVSNTHGGTGLNTNSAANGTLLIGNGGGFTLSTLTAGTNISIVNGVGGITISTTGTGTVNKYATTLSTSSTTYTVTHNLGTQDVVIAVYDTSLLTYIETDVETTTTNTATINFAVAPTAGQYRVVVMG